MISKFFMIVVNLSTSAPKLRLRREKVSKGRKKLKVLGTESFLVKFRKTLKDRFFGTNMNSRQKWLRKFIKSQFGKNLKEKFFGAEKKISPIGEFYSRNF